MKKRYYYALLVISCLGIVFSALEILNMMVSLKYETAGMGDCISYVSGINLCLTIKVLKGLLAVFMTGLICLITFRKKFLN